LDTNILKIKIAKLYYQNRLSKVEIGKKLRISRLTVAQCLDNALKEGLVKITIDEPKNSFIDLENKLEDKFKIHRAIIVESSLGYEQTKKDIGKAAAMYFTDIVYEGDVIGIAWGTTIYEMLNYLPSTINNKDTTVVQITGGLNQVKMEYNAIELTSRLVKILNSKSYQLFAPSIVESEDAQKMFLSESAIKSTIEMFDKVNIAIVGIGTVIPEPSSLLYLDGFIKKSDVDSIRSTNAIGDINSYFYDSEGRECITDLKNRVIGMDLSKLRKVRYAIGVAGGKTKADAIYSALKGKIINVIITDREVAEEILRKY